MLHKVHLRLVNGEAERPEKRIYPLPSLVDYDQPNQIPKLQNPTRSSWPALPPPRERPVKTFAPSVQTQTSRRALE